MENIEGDHWYFTANIKMFNKRNFDKALATIPLCYSEDVTFRPHLDTTSVLTLHPTHGFIWDQATPSGWEDEDRDYDD